MGATGIGQEAHTAPRQECGQKILESDSGKGSQFMLFIKTFIKSYCIFAEQAAELAGAHAGAAVGIDKVDTRVLVGTVIPVFDPAGESKGQCRNGIIA